MISLCRFSGKCIYPCTCKNDTVTVCKSHCYSYLDCVNIDFKANT